MTGLTGLGTKAPVITIDGPAGSGKSTTARALAERLGVRHLDSGALYRALTLAIVRAGVPEVRWDSLASGDLDSLDVRLRPEAGVFAVVLDGQPAGEELRSESVTRLVPILARVPAVRSRLLALQRSALKFGGLVADGRDMGTVVFPEAPLKVFLTASMEERARRRLAQEGKPTDPATLRAEAERLEQRDRSDTERPVAPLREAPGALLLDTTGLTFEEQVDRIVAALRARESVGS